MNKLHFATSKCSSVKVSEDDKDYYEVTGYATKFYGVDSYSDTIEPGAYLKSIQKNGTVPAFFMHKSHEAPVGLFTEMREDANGLHVTARLPKADKFVSDTLIPQMKIGSIDALSIGYAPLEVEYRENGIRNLKEIDLHEISFITKGYQADSQALITGVKRKEDVSDVNHYFNLMVDCHRKNMAGNIVEDVKDHYHNLGKRNPFEEGYTISISELKELTRSNMAYALRNLKLSSDTATFLVGLVQKSAKDTESNSPKDEVIPPVKEEDEDEKKKREDKIGSTLDTILKNLETKQNQTQES